MKKHEFLKEFACLIQQASIEEVCEVQFPSFMNHRHRRDGRSFAEVDPLIPAFYFAPQILELPRNHRRGVLMHEIGHVLCRDLPHGGSEKDADRAAERAFGVVLAYDRRFPGKGVQCVDASRKPR